MTKISLDIIDAVLAEKGIGANYVYDARYSPSTGLFSPKVSKKSCYGFEINRRKILAERLGITLSDIARIVTEASPEQREALNDVEMRKSCMSFLFDGDLPE